MAGPVASKAAASSAPAASANGAVAILLADVDVARLLLGLLLRDGLAEDPLPGGGGVREGLGVGVRPPIQDAVGRDLVVKAVDKGFDEVDVGLLISGRHIRVCTAVQDAQAGWPGEDRLVLPLGCFA